jgi:hypothetical protein
MGVYGAADSTLVNMAYHASMANVPLDQTALFAQREQNLKDFTGAVSKLFENQWKDHKATEKKRMDLAQDVEEIMLAGGNMNDARLDTHNDTVLGFKNELDLIKIDDTLDKEGKRRARQKLEFKMNRYKNDMTEEKTIFDEMVNYSASGYVYNTPGSPEAKTWNALLDDYKNGTDNAKKTVDSKTGEIFYTFDGNKMSLKDIKKGLTKHDPEFQTEFQKKINDLVGQLKEFQQDNKDVTPQQINQMKTTLSKGVNTMDQVRNIANMEDPTTGMTFNQILYGQGKLAGVNGHEMIDNEAIGLIHTQLDKLSIKHGHGTAGGGGNSAIDMNDDGVFDAEDQRLYHLPENAELLIKKIEEDKDLYKELVINYTMETNVKKVYANSMIEQLEAVRLEAEKVKAKKDMYEFQQGVTTAGAIKQKQTPTYGQDQAAQETKAIVTKANKAISTGDFGALSRLGKRGFRPGTIKDETTGKKKPILYYLEGGKPIKAPNGSYITIDIENKDLKTNEELQAEIMSYVTGSAIPSYDPLNPE